MYTMLSIIVAIAGIMLACLYPFIAGAGQSWPESNPDHRIATPGDTLYPVTVYPADYESFMVDTYPMYLMDTMGDDDTIEHGTCDYCDRHTTEDNLTTDASGLTRCYPPCNPTITDSDVTAFVDSLLPRDREVARFYGYEV